MSNFLYIIKKYMSFQENGILQSEPSELLIAAKMIKYSYDIEDKLVAIIYRRR